MKQYLVKKDVNKSNADDNWIIMTGKEFYRFLNTEDGQRRKPFFATLEGEAPGEEIIIECDRVQVKTLDAERKRKRYKKEIRANFKEVGFEEPVSKCGGSHTYSETIPSEALSPEELLIAAVEKEMLYKAIGMLSDNEKKVIMALFLNDESISGDKYAMLNGISSNAVSKTKIRALEKLKKFLMEMGFEG